METHKLHKNLRATPGQHPQYQHPQEIAGLIEGLVTIIIAL